MMDADAAALRPKGDDMNPASPGESPERSSEDGCLFWLVLACNLASSLAGLGLLALGSRNADYEGVQWAQAFASAVGFVLLIVQVGICLPASLVAAWFVPQDRRWLAAGILLIVLLPGIAAGLVLLDFSPR